MIIYIYILLALIITIVWNIITVIILAQKARQGLLTPLRFSLAFVLGLSIIVSTILFIGIAIVDRIDVRETIFVLLVFVLHFLIGLPLVFFLSKLIIGKYFPKWTTQKHRQR
jgi:hypothetical protein